MNANNWSGITSMFIFLSKHGTLYDLEARLEQTWHAIEVTVLIIKIGTELKQMMKTSCT